jgi:hypothetical protein
MSRLNPNRNLFFRFVVQCIRESERRLAMNRHVAQASCLRVRRASLPGEVVGQASRLPSERFAPFSSSVCTCAFGDGGFP